MTEEANAEVRMVECVLTGDTIKETEAIQFQRAEESEEMYVSGVAILKLVEGSTLKNIIMEAFALNDEAFNSIVSLRREAAAKQKGIQDGANEAIKRIQEAAAAEGVDLSSVLSKAFPQAEEETVEAKQA